MGSCTTRGTPIVMSSWRALSSPMTGATPPLWHHRCLPCHRTRPLSAVAANPCLPYPTILPPPPPPTTAAALVRLNKRFVEDGGVLKAIDFGLTSKVRCRMPAGTWRYMAPEVPFRATRNLRDIFGTVWAGIPSCLKTSHGIIFVAE